MKIAIYKHKDFLEHDTGQGHPECPDRLPVILKALKGADYANHLEFLDAPLAKEEDILLAHTDEYLQYVKDSRPVSSQSRLDADTVISPGSFDAALRAVGAGVAAVDDVMQNKYKKIFCAVRPPGHHACEDRAMGFCIFNNITVAALYAAKQYSLGKVAIVDFDVHHGNGTEDILKNKDGILYISTHQSPLFPGTGIKKEHLGNIINIPVSSGVSSVEYRNIFEESVMAQLEDYEPELLLVSAGFDAHESDPLAGLSLFEEDYKWIGQCLNEIAEKYCQSRIISFLEGGYNLEVLGSSVRSYLSGL